MSKQEEPMYLRALEISPMIWWRSIERSIAFTEGFAKLLAPQLNFRDWVEKGLIRHSHVALHDDSYSSLGDEIYRSARRNTYYDKVGGISQYGHEILAATQKSLETLHKIKEGSLFYQFRVADLFHFILVWFQHWRAFDEFYAWVRWQFYFEFIQSKIDPVHALLFEYMMMVVLSELEHYEKTFSSITQYKTFRDKLDEMDRNTKSLIEDYARMRDRPKKAKTSN
jgi:hypothetical protein